MQEINAVAPKEAVINGINLSAYDFNGNKLKDLVKALSKVDCRIRLGSLEVGVIDEELLTALKGLKNFAPHFHLSLQSGSNAVLKSMNRHYTREEFLQKVNLIRKYFPCAGITTDIIVGFPTETEQDFLDTLNLAKQVEFSDIHAFSFSPRKGTCAYKMKDLPAQVKKQRLDKLLELKHELKEKFIKENLNEVRTVLPEEFKEGYTEGYTENYIRVFVSGELDKDLTKVKLIKLYKDGALCTPCKE